MMTSFSKQSNIDLLETTIHQAKVLSEEIAQLALELSRSKKQQQTSGSSSESVTRSLEITDSTTQTSTYSPSTPKRTPQSNATGTPIAAVTTPYVSTSSPESSGRLQGPIVKTTTTVMTTKDMTGSDEADTGSYEPSQTSPRRRIVHKRVKRFHRSRRGTSPWSPWKQTVSYSEDREKEGGSEDDEEGGGSRSQSRSGGQSKNDEERAYLEAEIARLLKVEERLRSELQDALEQERELEHEMSNSRRLQMDKEREAGEKVRARLRKELAELVEMEHDLEERIREYTHYSD